ncbi:hypothetical protein [Micromonospora sp. HUAS LYJ1]|nr:hypothetical protein [Micromonospora sp. HUAS LYJ1]WKU04946.1 hypothetical protein Q2K16_29985 [Micromonospora sp. HUAS LYJ1]
MPIKPTGVAVWKKQVKMTGSRDGDGSPMFWKIVDLVVPLPAA